MNDKRRFLINVISSVTQSLVVAVTLFYLYRYLLHHLDTKSLGVWSVIFATASVSKIAELGISTGVVKFVAKWLALNERNNAADVIKTAATAVTLLIGFVLMVGYLSASWTIPLLVGNEYTPLAISILPYALLSFLLGALTSVYQSGLDGSQRMDYRSFLSIFSTLLYFFACIILVDSQGLPGLGIAQVLQSLFMLFGNYYMIRKVLPEIGLLFFGWNTTRFRELLSYGVNAQAASVSITLFSEPITKALLTNFGGLAMVTYYDMAAKMITQLRSVVLSAYQAIVPMIATMQESNKDEIPIVYKRSAEVMFLVSFIMFGAVIGFTPIISRFWIGSYVDAFVFSSYVLSIGWCINTLNVPAYMINLGTGNLRSNTICHVIMGSVNTIAGLLLSYFLGFNGGILGWGLALIAGSVYLISSFHKNYNIAFSEVFNRYTVWLVITLLLFCLVTLIVSLTSLTFLSTYVAVCGAVIVFSAIVLITQYQNPLMLRVVSFIGTHLAKR